jgi:hypothetical protein
MIRRSKEQWLSLFQQHANSGLTAAAFCRQYDLDQAYFSLRKTQLCSTDETAFVPVTREKKHNHTVTTSLKLQYHLESCSLQFENLPDVVWLSQLIKTLS